MRIVWIAALGGWGCVGDPADGPAPALPEPPAPAGLASEQVPEKIVGLVVAAVDEEITARVSGQLSEFLVGLGDTVEGGQPLARIANPELQHELSQARARAQAAISEERGASVRAQAAAEESEALSRLDGAIAKKDQEQAIANARESAERTVTLRARAGEARAALALLEEQRDALTVTGQTSGTVAALYKGLGERVERGQTVLRIVSDAQIVRFAVPAQIAIRKDQQVTIETRSGQAAEARVARIAPSVDSAGMVLAETTQLTESLQHGAVCTVTLAP